MHCNALSIPNRYLPGLAILLLLLTGSCSRDDPDPAPLQREVFLSAFSNTGSEEIQIDLRNDGSTPLLISLTDELGLQDLPFFLRDVDNASVGYYFWQDQQSRVRYKDLDSGDIFTVDNLCGFSGENQADRTIRRVSGNESYVVMPYVVFSDQEPPAFSLRILEKATGVCRDLAVPDINDSGVESYSLQGGTLALYYLETGTNAPLISLIDLTSGTIAETLILEANFQAATFRGPELWIFNQDDSYQVYNTQSGAVVRTGTAPGLPAPGPGLFESRFDGNRMLVRFIYQQPSLFFAQPAVYDFDQGAIVQGAEPFLPELQERVERETGDRVLFGNYGVDLPTGTIAIVYVRGDGSPEGGIVLTNFQREWLQVLPLPYVPERIEVREVR